MVYLFAPGAHSLRVGTYHLPARVVFSTFDWERLGLHQPFFS